MENKCKVWIAFKYENLLSFYFGCGKMGHKVKDCDNITYGIRDRTEDELSYSIALKAKSMLIGNEGLFFGAQARKFMYQASYIGVVNLVVDVRSKSEIKNLLVVRRTDVKKKGEGEGISRAIYVEFHKYRA